MISPFLLAATIRNHLMKYQQLYPTVTSTLDKCLYVDDLICSAPSVQEAASLSMQAKAILKDAGMTLCKWSTNSDELKNLWKEKMENTVSGNVEVKRQPSQSGCLWEHPRVCARIQLLEGVSFTFLSEVSS